MELVVEKKGNNRVEIKANAMPFIFFCFVVWAETEAESEQPELEAYRL